ncbi:MAG: FAD binding domain-containing protein [Gemmatimonadota bacterium]
MRFERASSASDALAKVALAPDAQFIAGGTELVNWIRDGIAAPSLVIDLSPLPLRGIRRDGGVIVIGALERLADVAAHAMVRRDLPAVAAALEAAASPQIRNMGTIGGNLLQRTRCPYFRADAPTACNRRDPGSGCSALEGDSRHAAILGWKEACVAVHASDLAVALLALDAVLVIETASGPRRVPLAEFYPDESRPFGPETTLGHGELIVAVEVPLDVAAGRSRFLKARDRASFEFALVSAAAAVAIEGGRIVEARVALGGVASRPWRLWETEAALRGAPVSASSIDAAVTAGLAGARPLKDNAYKVELARRVAAAVINQAGGAA